MPRRAAAVRAQQFATLSTIIHQKEVSEQLGDLLAKAEAGNGHSVEEQALVRVMRRSYEQKTKLPESFVAELAKLTSQAQVVWTEAREKDDFSLFGRVLEKLVDMARQQTEYLGYEAHPYDALLDLYEEGLATLELEKVFAEIKAPLSNMVAALKEKGAGLDFAEPFALDAQERFAEHLLNEIGFDFERGCLARSVHPFTTSLGHHDRRVTNRYAAHGLEFIFGALHEGGHALYEQGIADVLAQSHLDTGVSLGIHESQSRLWENIIGRSREFWQSYYPALQKAFPAQFAHCSMDDFYNGINIVRPGLIRVDADEVSYNLHVLIRFELEKALIEGNLHVADLPVAWNEKYRDLLGVDVPSASMGVLQDIHWSHGSFGYFPTYTIGNLASAQIWDQYKRFDPQYQDTLGSGNLGKVKAWLTETIYEHGSIYPPTELLHKISGEPLSATYFLEYLAEKYGVKAI